MSDTTLLKRQPLVVEPVGLAGVGKTTLLQTLSQQNENISTTIHLNKVRLVPFFISNTLPFVPTFLRQYKHSRWFTWKEIRSMVYLKAWRHVLDQKTPGKDKIIMLDHGPIFKLVQLREFGPEFTKSTRYNEWWYNTLAQWTETLDVVIWLDAPDETLLDRINTRSTNHTVKGKPKEEGYELLTRYRKSFQEIKAKLTTNSNLTFLHFQTDQHSPEQIANEVMAMFETKLNNG